ncbi:MAG: glycerol kinase, partial [Geminicoccaceae bacterium]|nr:glycerol kinase [Geminicoccaceae bacterium]
ETTALGAAFLAGLAIGLYPSQAFIAESWRADGRFTPQLDPSTRRRRLDGWAEAVGRVRTRGR